MTRTAKDGDEEPPTRCLFPSAERKSTLLLFAVLTEAPSVWEDDAVQVCPLLLGTKGDECSRNGHVQVRNVQSSLDVRAASRPPTYGSWHGLRCWSCTLISVETCQSLLLRIWLQSSPSSISQVVPLHICFVQLSKTGWGCRAVESQAIYLLI